MTHLSRLNIGFTRHTRDISTLLSLLYLPTITSTSKILPSHLSHYSIQNLAVNNNFVSKVYASSFQSPTLITFRKSLSISHLCCTSHPSTLVANTLSRCQELYLTVWRVLFKGTILLCHGKGLSRKPFECQWKFERGVDARGAAL